jgi:hypothetical protein
MTKRKEVMELINKHLKVAFEKRKIKVQLDGFWKGLDEG